MLDSCSIGVLGATSLVGELLLDNLVQQDRHVIAFSRKEKFVKVNNQIEWLQLPVSRYELLNDLVLHHWISVVPIWVLPDYFSMLESCQAKRVVSLSSTSLFSKAESGEPEDRTIAQRLAEGERQLQEWAENKGIEWVILRPTMIYSRGKDRNISEIVRFVSRFGFFPLFGKAMGLRQPIHAEDVANACLAVLHCLQLINKAYNLSGDEVLPYKKMVERIFIALHRKPCFISIPLPLFKVGVWILRWFPRYRKWSGSMVERMNRDLIYSHEEAAKDFGFKPRKFELTDEDIGKIS
jgi:nucleoside-diphosphate-sugar epimerase